MRYISVDLETTGLDTNKCQIVMASFVLEDTERPEVPLEELKHCTALIRHENYYWESYALNMNQWIVNHLYEKFTPFKVLTPEDWENEVLKYLFQIDYRQERKFTLAGKNIGGFDSKFLPKSILNRCHYRYIDVGSVCIDWSKDKVGSLSDLKNERGLGKEVTHNAYYDALDVIKILRTTYKR